MVVCDRGKVELMYTIENNMPRFLQKRVHVKKAVIKPTDGTTCAEKVCFMKNIIVFCRPIWHSEALVRFVLRPSKPCFCLYYMSHTMPSLKCGFIIIMRLL